MFERVCLRVHGEGHLFSAAKHINQLFLGDKHTTHNITIHIGFLGFKVAVVR